MSEEVQSGNYSDMMKHYLNIKKAHSDCIIFYRLGDFYEMFFDDAKLVSNALDLTLTGRDCGGNQRAPMCGVPFHSADEYISRLVSMGYKVAICEQLETVEEAKEKGKVKGKAPLVERGVIKIVSAGTVTEDEYIDEQTNNFLCCVYLTDLKCALAWCDITTGQFFARKCESADRIAELSDNIVRIAPAEIICNKQAEKILNDIPVVTQGVVPAVEGQDENNFLTVRCEELLKEQLKVASLDSFEFSDDYEVIAACGGLIAYLRETQMHSLININRINYELNRQYMGLDANAIRNLELTGNLRDGKKCATLLWVINKAYTPMGARNIKNWLISPLQDIDKINYRLDGVEELFKNPVLRGGIYEQLRTIRDIERSAGKISNNNISPQAVLRLGQSLQQLPGIKMLLFGVKSKILNDINDYLVDFTDMANILVSAISPEATVVNKNGGYIKDGFDKQLDELRNTRKNSKTQLNALEARERESTGIKNLRVVFSRVFGYSIEVTNSFKNLVPYNYVRKQTLTNAERYVTDELKTLEEQILTSDEKALKLEQEIFTKVKNMLRENVKQLQSAARAIACLDTLLAFATVAKKQNYVRPELMPKGSPINIVGGRHPVVECVTKEQFISNDLYLDEDNSIMVITGPNMAGKSTYMRQTALITLLAHIGCFVPAKSAEIPVTDKIFTRIGASDNLALDQSTFMVEMSEVANILSNATKDSLLVLDEVGRGTSTYDGLSIAWAVVEYIAEKIKAKTLFATHYHELSELEGVLKGVRNYKITVRESKGEIVFLRKIMRGSANRSFGIEVASLAGVPGQVTERAKKILKDLEKNDLIKKIPDEEDEDAEEIEVEQKPSEVENILHKTDVNTLTPLDALRLLFELKGKLK